MQERVLSRKLSIVHYQLSILLVLFLVASCSRNKRSGSSDQESFTQQETADMLLETADTLQETADTLQQQALIDFDTETYVIPPGIKYTESREVDVANPPVVLDIANRNLQIKKFDLSDYYTQVRYIKLKHPESESGGKFFFDTSGYMEFEKGIIHTGIVGLFFHRGSSGIAYNSLFRFTNDYIIAGDAFFGIHCYDKQGIFLYTIEPVDHPNVYDAFNNYIWFHEVHHKGYNGGLTAIGNYCLYRVREDNQNWLCQYDLTQGKRIMTRPYEKNALLLDDHSMVSYVYHPVRTHDFFYILLI